MAIITATAAAAISALTSTAAGLTAAKIIFSPVAADTLASLEGSPDLVARLRCEIHKDGRCVKGYGKLLGDVLMLGSSLTSLQDVISLQAGIVVWNVDPKVLKVERKGEPVVTIFFESDEEASVWQSCLEQATRLSSQMSAIDKICKQEEKQQLLAQLHQLEEEFEKKMAMKADQHRLDRKELEERLQKASAQASKAEARAAELQNVEGRSQQLEEELAELQALCAEQEAELMQLRLQLQNMTAETAETRQTTKDSNSSRTSKSTVATEGELPVVIRRPVRRLMSDNISQLARNFEDNESMLTRSEDLPSFAQKAPSAIRMLSKPSPLWTMSRANTPMRLELSQ
mmetsp:Transcript_65841/g.116696  ORF Transcript_65841/g.116696 Transcript_65841/m.116696 type:complete len:344 (-) Transcript_65841:64-1095(-)|eukprot:CAMPEP_0197652326 /NCGR_PEP_ID=MMETSP1338-20131121/34386_1 /TAXON_ID=43686 ORGANISM="Pelagodinium beii, Strain RCC1491" /NCGR_SAMPLE_ID=MMETSP1338 /ASSEMBLY_ACC=CAM_ASM_000754 /LENGTH=343 /DNA_ID=CAMNT_0043227181 /DNA_START=50 /DNA_END=1081 /DNA_ORIENTATION=+